jgi:nucleoside-diphosphate-sugar epimerase
MTLKVAILGASGFIGNRIVEMFHLADLADVRPIVRRVASLASLSRFEVDCHVADAFDRAALCTAFAGCEVVVHAVAGDRKVILGTLAPTYYAAQAAGVRRLVYISTAAVHGQAPAPGTDENSPLHTRQPIPYNNAKIQAERRLRRLCRRGTVEVVILRPGIVVGPRSSWIASFANALLTDQAYLVHRGQGICNSIYIDNLVHAIYLALTATAADGEAFLLGDRERVTWADLYQPIAAALGVDLTQVPEAPVPAGVPSWRERVQAMGSSPAVQALGALAPRPLKRMAHAALGSWYPFPVASAWALPNQPEAVVSREMALLYQCQYKLPFAKATKILGYTPIVSFPEACRRTVAWLAFAGYRLADSGWGGEKR